MKQFFWGIFLDAKKLSDPIYRYNQPPKQKEVINDHFVENKSYLHFQQKIERGSIKKATNKGT